MLAMRNILIAIPAFTWQVNLALVTFLCQVIGREHKDARFHLVALPEVAPVHYARNCLVAEFLRQKEMSHLWFIDHDMMPEVSALAILDVDGDIVSGRCLAARTGDRGMELYVTAFTDRNPDTGVFTGVRDNPAEPVPVVGAGAASLLVCRAVLEDPRMQLAPDYVDLVGRPRSLQDEEGAAPAIFRTLYKPNGQILLGEDLDFVFRASQLGYRCMYQPAARMGHLKVQDLNGIEQMLRRELHAQARRDHEMAPP